MQNFTDIITEAKSTFKLMKIDLQQFKCNRREAKIVIATSSLLTKIKVSESCKSQFHDDAQNFILIEPRQSKPRQRNPQWCKLTRTVSAQNPVIIYYGPDLGKKRVNELLVILHDSKWINATLADRANSQYHYFLGITKVSIQ